MFAVSIPEAPGGGDALPIEHVLPAFSASGRLTPLQPAGKYLERQREANWERLYGRGAGPWGTVEGHPVFSSSRRQESFLWQSRTRWEGVHQDWTSMPDDLSAQIERAYQRQAHGLEIVIKGNTFVVTFHDNMQRNKADPGKVRDVRRVKAELRDWWLVDSNIGENGTPERLTDAESAMIEQGAGASQQAHGALLYNVPRGYGEVLHVDMLDAMAYDSLGAGARKRRMLAIPRSISQAICDRDGFLSPSSELYALIVKQFEETKWGATNTHSAIQTRPEDVNLNTDVKIVQIKCHVRCHLLIQFLEKMRRMGSDCRMVQAYHGTSRYSRHQIIEANFSPNKIGASTGNYGWFGKGIYFGRRAYTALGYAEEGDTELLCCLVLVSRVFNCPEPDGPDNPYHGQPCKEGFDAHLSPTGKELVVFNIRQILPCFVLCLNAPGKTTGMSEYQGN